MEIGVKRAEKNEIPKFKQLLSCNKDATRWGIGYLPVGSGGQGSITLGLVVCRTYSAQVAPAEALPNC